MFELEAGMPTKRKKVWQGNPHCALLHFSLTPCDTSCCNKFWQVMKNLHSRAHPGIILPFPPSGKINLFAYKIFILYSSVIHSFKSKKFKPYLVWRKGESGSSFHIQIMMLRVFPLLDQVSKRVGFPHPRNFFSIRLWAKRQKPNKQTNKPLWISKLKFAHFYNACQDSSPWLRKGYTISVRSHK